MSGGRTRGERRTRALRPSALAVLVAAAVAAGPGLPSPAGAQDASTAIRTLSPENAELYLTPLTLSLGRALSTGLVPALRSAGAFDLRLGLRLVTARVPDDRLAFQPVLPTSVTYRGAEHQAPFQGGGVSPTVAARAGGSAVVEPRSGSSFEAALLAAGEDPGDFALAFPGGLGLDTPWVPLLEATLGLGLGTDLVARFAPTLSWDDGLGDASVFGVALLHGLDRWLGLTASPLDLRLAGSLHRVRAGGWLEELSTTLGLVAGTRIGSLDLYAHGRVEDVRARVTQRVSNPADSPALPPDGASVVREIHHPSGTRVGVGAILHGTPLTVDAEVAPLGGGALSLRITLTLPGGEPRGEPGGDPGGGAGGGEGGPL